MVTWDEFWDWARNSGIPDRAACEAILGYPIRDVDPSTVQDALCDRMGPVWDAEREAAEMRAAMRWEG